MWTSLNLKIKISGDQNSIEARPMGYYEQTLDLEEAINKETEEIEALSERLEELHIE